MAPFPSIRKTMSKIELAVGQTHQIKGGRGKASVEAKITSITKRGLGHTVSYQVGKNVHQASAGSFRSKLAIA